MGNIKDALICGYYDENMDFIVEFDSALLSKYIPDEYKDFSTNIQKKIQLYNYIKNQMVKDLEPKCNQFVIELR